MYIQYSRIPVIYPKSKPHPTTCLQAMTLTLSLPVWITGILRGHSQIGFGVIMTLGGGGLDPEEVGHV